MYLDIWKEGDPELASDNVKKMYRKLVKEYLLGLEHNALYSLESRGIRLVKQQIFDNLKVFRKKNIELFMEYVDELEKHYHLCAPLGSQLRQLMVKRALVSK
jgi:hypothetical protein